MTSTLNKLLRKLSTSDEGSDYPPPPATSLSKQQSIVGSDVGGGESTALTNPDQYTTTGSAANASGGGGGVSDIASAGSNFLSNTSRFLSDQMSSARQSSMLTGIQNTLGELKRRASIENLGLTESESSELADKCGPPVQPQPPLHSTQPPIPATSSIVSTTSSAVTSVSSTTTNQQSPQLTSRVSISKKVPPPKPPAPLGHQSSLSQQQSFDEATTKSESASSSAYASGRMLQNSTTVKGPPQKPLPPPVQHQPSLQELTQMECQRIVSTMDSLIDKASNNNCQQTAPNAKDSAVIEEDSSSSEYGDKPVYDDNTSHPIKSQQQQEELMGMTGVATAGRIGLTGTAATLNLNNKLPNSDDIDDKEGHEQDENHREISQFMDQFIKNNISSENPSNSPIQRRQFTRYIQTASGRFIFAKQIENLLHKTKSVDEHVFFQLVRFVSVVLVECNDCEDYLPVRNLMLIAFGCHTKIKVGASASDVIMYLSSFLSGIPIWNSLRFWNSAYFNAIQEIRQKKVKPIGQQSISSSGRPLIRRNSSNQSDMDGVAFHQLQVHLNYMRSLGLSGNLCQEFIRRQSEIVNLDAEETRKLKELIEGWKD